MKIGEDVIVLKCKLGKKQGLKDMKLLLIQVPSSLVNHLIRKIMYSNIYSCIHVVSFDLSLARGLDYCTDVIEEAVSRFYFGTNLILFIRGI